eukprot:gene16808-23090_t
MPAPVDIISVMIGACWDKNLGGLKSARLQVIGKAKNEGDKEFYSLQLHGFRLESCVDQLSCSTFAGHSFCHHLTAAERAGNSKMQAEAHYRLCGGFSPMMGPGWAFGRIRRPK